MAMMTDPYVRFWMAGDTEFATMTAADFRAAMLERDHEIARLRAEIVTWGEIWNNAELLAARVEALRDGTAQT